MGNKVDEDTLGTTGAAYLIHGPVAPSTTLTMEDVDATWMGAKVGDEAGASVASVGDVDGDGHDDVLIMALHAVYLVAGPGDGTTNLADAEARLLHSNPSDLTLHNNILDGSVLKLYRDDYELVLTEGTSTIDSDPLLMDPTAADFALQASSPAIDAGDASVVGYASTDYFDDERFDAPVANTGAGTPSYSDIGAIEY